MTLPTDDEAVNLGPLPPHVDRLLQQGVTAYRRDPAGAERLFRMAMAAAPTELAVYFCMYKIHAYRGKLDEALAAAEAGLKQAARQAGWGEDVARWPCVPLAAGGPERFALYTLKAIAFIHLKRDDRARARRALDALARLDPAGLVGWHVVADLAKGLG
jgi:hypothetical protein